MYINWKNLIGYIYIWPNLDRETYTLVVDNKKKSFCCLFHFLKKENDFITWNQTKIKLDNSYMQSVEMIRKVTLTGLFIGSVEGGGGGGYSITIEIVKL